jgi:hypothetical protein
MNKTTLTLGDMIVLPGAENRAVVAKVEAGKYYAVPIGENRLPSGKPVELVGDVLGINVCGKLYGDYKVMMGEADKPKSKPAGKKGPKKAAKPKKAVSDVDAPPPKSEDTSFKADDMIAAPAEASCPPTPTSMATPEED